ncbi:ROK family transcriptional regulator [Dactylosporangium matsuzakiense]|uniref:Sugar kinase n=1 Tax=Dactylosporangium matsuzakiense TaxID=53360 RepID=A0A9W6KWX8_9ACTN|nr:ROK family transcriptional regulator [Dactylosporangium matsuzakiense]UWZ41258.1 ROK family protein [Dactylosporangium matsuzakiense]GLL08194.1 sugar kinase [Dactylosporangium matsuzakiense]
MQTTNTASTTSVLRVMNERAVFAETFRLGTVSRPELAQQTGLSKPTVAVALTNLERAGLLRRVGTRAGAAGRSAMLYEVRPEAGWVFAVDVGRSYVRVGLADLVGTIVARKDEPSRGTRARDLVAQLTRLAEELAGQAGITRDDVTLAVFGTPGIHDKATGALHLAPNLPGWDRRGSVERLAGIAGSTYVVENDVDLAAVGEATYGLGRGVRHFVYVSIGTGTGMGIIIDGRLYRGFRGAAGEIGYLPIGEGDPLLEQPAARPRGMFESVASADGIVGVARRLGLPGAVTAKDVFDAARAGEETARLAVSREVDHVSHALAGITAVLDPELVVLGGGVGSQLGDLFTSPLTERLRTLVALRPPRIEVSTLGPDAVLLGALAVGLAEARTLVLDRTAPTR